MALKELLGSQPSGYEISGLNSVATETREFLGDIYVTETLTLALSLAKREARVCLAKYDEDLTLRLVISVSNSECG
jgi:hypothetical protein